MIRKRMAQCSAFAGHVPLPLVAGESHMQNEPGIASLFSSTCFKDDSALFAFRFPHAIALPTRGRGMCSRPELPSQILQTLGGEIDLLARRGLAAAGAVLVGARDVAGA